MLLFFITSFQQANCVFDGEVLPLRTSGIHCPQQSSPPHVSTVVESCTVFPIYENLCRPMSAAGPRNLTANNQDELNTSNGIYVEPLPYTASDRVGDDSAGKHTNYRLQLYTNVTTYVTNKPTDSHTDNASACLSRPHSNYTDVSPRSLWFGLDLSKIYDNEQ